MTTVFEVMLGRRGNDPISLAICATQKMAKALIDDEERKSTVNRGARYILERPLFKNLGEWASSSSEDARGQR